MKTFATLAVSIALLLSFAVPAAAQEPVLSGFQHTAFSLSFDASSVDQVGNDSPDLVFRDVSFGVAVPVASRLGVWFSVSKAADFNRHAEARKLTGSFGGGLSYVVARRKQRHPVCSWRGAFSAGTNRRQRTESHGAPNGGEGWIPRTR